MAIQVALYHKTEYRYNRKVMLGPQVILKATPHPLTTGSIP